MSPEILSYRAAEVRTNQVPASMLSPVMAVLAAVLCLPLTLRNIADFLGWGLLFTWLALAGCSYLGAIVTGWRALRGGAHRGGTLGLLICALLLPAVLVRNTILGYWFILRGFG